MPRRVRAAGAPSPARRGALHARELSPHDDVERGNGDRGGEGLGRRAPVRIPLVRLGERPGWRDWPRLNAVFPLSLAGFAVLRGR